ncbi:MAG: hypothetical protein ACRD0N_03040 [Acidimicrobiales bacterium]
MFVSSHLLTEVQATCDRVAILTRGRCVAAGPVQEVLSAGRSGALLVRLDDLAAGLTILQAAGVGVRMDGDALRVELAPAEAATVTRVLAGAGLWVTELRPHQVSLEDVFLELTGGAPGAGDEEAA